MPNRTQYSLTLLVCFMTIMLISCSKDCGPKSPRCNDMPNSGVCQAYFESWFYNKETNSCEKMGYSGCSPKGFENKTDCEKCQCKD